VLDCEGLGVDRVLAVVTPPAPLHRLIKDDITGDDDALVDGVVAAVGFGARFIAHEDHLDAPII
jgi:hypothetical protein